MQPPVFKMLLLSAIIGLFTNVVLAQGTFRTQAAPQTVCADKGQVGYFDFENGSKHLFFWLAESRHDPDQDPVVLWLSGGPGASSVGFGMFQELGPCVIQNQTSTVYNNFSWNDRANVLFIECGQPVNVGFSYSDNPVETLDEAMDDLYLFLTSFMSEFPQFAQQDFYIVAESYGGTWGPALGRKIWTRQHSPMAQVVRSTSDVTHPDINLKGIALGNAQLSQALQWPGFFATGCVGKDPLFNETVCAVIESHLPECDRLLGICSQSDRNLDVCSTVLDYCRDKSVFLILDEKRNPYDIRKTCEGDIGECYAEHDWIRKYLNSEHVKKDLGIPIGVSFDLVDTELEARFMSTGEALYDSSIWAEELLSQGYSILVYAGDKDWFCNAAGEQRMVNGLQWKHQASFNAAQLETYTMNGREIGSFKRFGALTYAEVYDAGHMVPFDKPEEALFLINSWLGHGIRST